jgi:hypothetical protein
MDHNLRGVCRPSELLYVSASVRAHLGRRRTPCLRHLLQCYAGFAGLNRHPDIPPRVGFARLDPMCGLMLAIVAAGLWHRQRAGGVARRFLTIEAMLWTMAELPLATQLDAPPQPQGNYLTATSRTASTAAPRGRLDQHRCPQRREWRKLCAIVRPCRRW